MGGTLASCPITVRHRTGFLFHLTGGFRPFMVTDMTNLSELNFVFLYITVYYYTYPFFYVVFFILSDIGRVSLIPKFETGNALTLKHFQ